jgi:hypothetical protein
VPVDEDEPISYQALEPGTPVVSSSGSEFGKVHHVLQVPSLDLFDGISVKTKHGLRFVDRDQIDEIRTTIVRTALSDEQASSLPPPEGPPSVTVDLERELGPSLTARLGRLFGRPHWKNLDE